MTYVATLVTADQDVRQKHTYGIINVAASGHLSSSSNHSNLKTLFSIESPSGLVTLSRADLSYEKYNNYTITVISTDSGSPPYSVTGSFVVLVTDVHEPPTDVTLTNNKVYENSRVGTVVGTFDVNDPDNINVLWQTHQCVITNSAPVPFKIVNQTTLVLAENTLNYESESLYLLNVTCFEVLNVNFSISRTFFVNVLDVNEAPFDLRISNNTVLENENVGTLVGVITADDPDHLVLDDNDPPSLIVLNYSQIYENSPNGSLVGVMESVDQDAGQKHSYVLIDKNDTFFISGNKLLAKPLDYEVEKTVNVTVKTTDNGMPPRSNEIVLLISVLDCNDPPTGVKIDSKYILGNNTMVTIKENSPSNMPLANLTVEDQDFAQQHSWTLLSGSEFFDILTVNSSSSVLRVKQGAILDYEKHREQPISVLIQCTDSGSPPYSVNVTQAISLIDVNEVPTNFSYSGQLTVMENSKYGTVIPGRFSCQQWDPEEMECSFEVVGKYAEVFKVNKNKSLVVINSTWLNYEAIPPPAILDVTINATDSGLSPSRWLTRHVHISVLDMNEPPSDLRIQQSSILENVTIGYCLEVTCFNPEPYQRINFTLLSTFNATFALRDSCENRTRGKTSVFLTVLAHLSYDVTNSYDFRIALDDGYGGSLTEPVSLNVTKVDPCPHVTDCHVNATCRRMNGRQHKCVCKLGYAGDGYKNCTETDECLAKPCNFEGNCTDRLHNYTCVCPTGYQSSYSFLPLPYCRESLEYSCESYFPQCQETDDCEPNPCDNGAGCTDSLNDYTCSCKDGFEGRNCSINIDECKVYGCGAHGSCTDGINSFTCQCSEGYFGTQCQRQRKHCQPNPCEPLESVCVQPSNWDKIDRPPALEVCAPANHIIKLTFKSDVFTQDQVGSPVWKFKLQRFFKNDIIIPISELTFDGGDVNHKVGLSDVIFVEMGSIVDSDKHEYSDVKFVAKANYTDGETSKFVPREGFFRALNRTCQPFLYLNPDSFEVQVCKAVFAAITNQRIPSQQTFTPQVEGLAQKGRRSTIKPLYFYVGGSLCGIVLVVLLVVIGLSSRNSIKAKQRRQLKYQKFVSKNSDELFTDVLRRRQLACEANSIGRANVNPLCGREEEDFVATVHMQDNPLYQSPMQDSNLPEESQVGVEFSNPIYETFKEIEGQTVEQSDC